MKFDYAPEFSKDLSKLQKKWRSLPDDIKRAEKIIGSLYGETVTGDELKEYRQQFFSGKTATILSSGESYEVVKIRLDCASLKSNKKTRVVFIALVEKKSIRFIELFAKNNNEREDDKRIKKYTPQRKME